MKIRLILTLLTAAVAMLLCGNVFAGKVRLDAGTPVKVKFDPNVKVSSGSSVEGVPVRILLAEPITMGGQVIVEAGAEGTATVKKVQKNGRGGKPGYISVEFASLGSKGEFKAAGDGRIKLAGVAEDKGKGKKTLSYLFIFGLFIKGGQGEMDPGQVYTATIAENVLLEN
jgi:hypothetical protein